MKTSKVIPAFRKLAIATVALASLSLAAKADISAYTYPAPTPTPANSPTPPPNGETDLGAYGMSGFEFTLNENIDLTQLGFTALSLGGDTPHVSLWSVGSGGALTLIYDTGNILSDVTSNPEGTGDAVTSYVSVGTPIALSSGSTYLITAPAYWAATFPSTSVVTTPAVFSSTSFVTDGSWNGWPNSGYAGFTGSGLGGTSGSLTDFSTASSTQTPVEADFQFTLAASPEPSTYALLGGGLLLLILVQRRRLMQS